jgi:predicted naringenin-chalcone synthase
VYGASIVFVLDEIQRRRRRNGDQTERDDMLDCEWGVMLGVGPGVTVETMVLLHAAGKQDEY